MDPYELVMYFLNLIYGNNAFDKQMDEEDSLNAVLYCQSLSNNCNKFLENLLPISIRLTGTVLDSVSCSSTHV